MEILYLIRRKEFNDYLDKYSHDVYSSQIEEKCIFDEIPSRINKKDASEIEIIPSTDTKFFNLLNESLYGKRHVSAGLLIQMNELERKFLEKKKSYNLIKKILDERNKSSSTDR